MPDASSRQQFLQRTARGQAALRLYGILDAESCSRRGLNVLRLAEAWNRAGIRLVQYRDKLSSPNTVKETALRLRQALPDSILLLNDYVNLVDSTGCDGVHVGQTDASVIQARQVIGPDRILGVSTHSVIQAHTAARPDVDYVAIGPVYATQTKQDAEPVVGLEGVRAARVCVPQWLVAIGGISPDRVGEVRDAGADAVALISGLLPASGAVDILTEHAQDILARLK